MEYVRTIDDTFNDYVIVSRTIHAPSLVRGTVSIRSLIASLKVTVGFPYGKMLDNSERNTAR